MRKDSGGEFWEVAAAGLGATVSFPVVAVGVLVIGVALTATIVYAKSQRGTGRPELKRQGREPLEKKKNNGKWKKRSGKAPRSQPRPHHPSKKGHQKYKQRKTSKNRRK